MLGITWPADSRKIQEQEQSISTYLGERCYHTKTKGIHPVICGRVPFVLMKSILLSH